MLEATSVLFLCSESPCFPSGTHMVMFTSTSICHRLVAFPHWGSSHTRDHAYYLHHSHFRITSPSTVIIHLLLYFLEFLLDCSGQYFCIFCYTHTHSQMENKHGFQKNKKKRDRNVHNRYQNSKCCKQHAYTLPTSEKLNPLLLKPCEKPTTQRVKSKTLAVEAVIKMARNAGCVTEE